MIPMDDHKTPPRPFNPAEASQVAEIERMHEQQFGRIEGLLKGWDEKVAARISGIESKAEQTSVTLFRAVPRRWRWLAIVGTLLGVGGGTSAATAWTAWGDIKKEVAEEALRERAAAELEASTRAHMASPHVDPSAAANLAIEFDKLTRRLDDIDSKLQRLDTKRGR